VKNRNPFILSLATLAIIVLISWGSVLNAQTTPSATTDQQTPQTQPTPSPDTPPAQQTPQTQQTPTPDAPTASQTPSQQAPSSSAPSASPSTTAPDSSQTPTSQAGSATSSDSQMFAGTVVKSGDKYVLKDDSGKTYDIDHQDDVKKFEGKRVRVQGTLDATGTKIQVK
jgi:outer membrane biosynthesis protein TonB